MKLTKQLHNLRQKGFSVIKDIVSKHGEVEVIGVMNFLDNNGEEQRCNIISIYCDTSFKVKHKGFLNEEKDYCELPELHTEALLNIAEQIQL